MSDLFTTAEAAALTQAPPRAIEKAIEEGIVEVHRGAPPQMAKARSRRLLSEQGIYFVAFMKGCGVEFSKSHKRSIWDHFRATPPNRLLDAHWRISAGVDVRPGEVVRPVLQRLKWYARARSRWIESKADVFGGTPVVKGTRMSVYSVAGRIEHGETADDILQDNPDLKREAVEAALAYARANPLVGRPGGKPWRSRA
jgi:uncharacterized protein (DUF433 family)